MKPSVGAAAAMEVPAAPLDVGVRAAEPATLGSSLLKRGGAIAFAHSPKRTRTVLLEILHPLRWRACTAMRRDVGM
jgi:hypothetical protein